ncbi:hypothetical protein EFV37_33720 [Mesorhizobium loti]|uniref:Uncharacterized protein n=1 Tax=Rhizobium loti TaxID=381 RepID=A0A6M7U837_RHILI|nr:hypothetical protein A9174_32960 [Mesorhizobium loti NZP2037]OBP78564.1 hypothetical protein BAE41_30490 [Mesorhizobium loti]QKC66585.1 hypothetical protein EB229_33715 [Mesorhizobium jarvisii]OBP97331.1 hypothetical protein BAE38_00010 [Mesorhizobium loti]OBQ59026.1 hypothetical protein A8145_25535 [Mesorhizobium loti]
MCGIGFVLLPSKQLPVSMAAGDLATQPTGLEKSVRQTGRTMVQRSEGSGGYAVTRLTLPQLQ